MQMKSLLDPRAQHDMNNYTPTAKDARPYRRLGHRRIALGLVLASVAFYLLTGSYFLRETRTRGSFRSVSPEVLARCRSLDEKPGPPSSFHQRTESDRFVSGTTSVLILNATIWTGNQNGEEIISGDVLLDRGLIKWIGEIPVEYRGTDLEIIDAKGSWVTPGIIDVHSHMGVQSALELSGASDGNSLKGPILPWLRSLDGLNTHDSAIELAIAGGLTTSLILPGSANAIGGQGFAIKHRPTKERTPSSWILEPPYGLNGSEVDYSLKPRWRHMKHACGENPARVYGQTRMDTMWNFRSAYAKAQEIKEAQDSFCFKALNGQLTAPAKFPEDLQWEAAVDVLRGKVKVQTHCYEAVDLDDFVRLSNEFKFPIAAFHHAHETYLVPDALKRAYGNIPPASAMFASFSRYKREAYRHSVFAPRILNDADLRVVMKSDHAAIVSRYLLHEAQQAHYYGLPANIALRSVMSTAAEVLGYDHRIGYIREGYDADIVVWDSHPLQLGATPKQVFIDGIAQLTSPHIVEKSSLLQKAPVTPNFDEAAKETLEYEGLPPLEAQKTISDSTIAFINVKNVFTRNPDAISLSELTTGVSTVIVRSGEIVSICKDRTCDPNLTPVNTTYIDLKGGSISPGLVSYGSNLGLAEIGMEDSTVDGSVYDALTQDIPQVVGGDESVIRASDGLIFSTRNALLAYRAGITSAITPPGSYGFFSGLSVHFSTGAPYKVSPGAVIQDVAALHVSIDAGRQPSVSTQIAALRRILTQKQKGDLGFWIDKVLKGELPLVVDVHSADEIASLLMLKDEVERKFKSSIRMTLSGATESHLLAKEIGEANVGVILNPVRPYPASWSRRRILPGPPLSEESAVVHLLRHNVTVGFGLAGGDLPSQILGWAAQNTRFDVSWAYIEAGGKISKAEAIALASTNTEFLLGVHPRATLRGDLVVTEGGDLLDLSSKVVGVIASRRGLVELF